MVWTYNSASVFRLYFAFKIYVKFRVLSFHRFENGKHPFSPFL